MKTRENDFSRERRFREPQGDFCGFQAATMTSKWEVSSLKRQETAGFVVTSLERRRTWFPRKWEAKWTSQRQMELFCGEEPGTSLSECSSVWSPWTPEWSSGLRALVTQKTPTVLPTPISVRLTSPHEKFLKSCKILQVSHKILQTSKAYRVKSKFQPNRPLDNFSLFLIQFPLSKNDIPCRTEIDILQGPLRKDASFR